MTSYCTCRDTLPQDEWQSFLDTIHSNSFNDLQLEDIGELACTLFDFYTDMRKTIDCPGSPLQRLKALYDKRSR